MSQGRWRRVRDVVEPYFAHPSAKQYVGMIRGVAHDYVQELAQTLALRAGEEGEFLFDAAQDTKFYSFLTVARIFYGDLDEQQTKVLKGIAPGREALWKHVIDGGLSRLSISRFLPTEANRCFIEFQSDWQKFNQEAFEKQLKLGGTAPICQIWKAMDEGRISKTEVALA